MLAQFGPVIPPTPAFPSPGTPGSAGGLVTFNEIHYHPAIAGATEWVEIVNQCAVRLDLSGWQITGGIDFTFPAGASIGAGQHLVVAKNPSRIVTVYGLNPALVLGPWSGKLGNSGDTVQICDEQGGFLAWGAYNSQSQIIARVWSWQADEQIDAEFFA